MADQPGSQRASTGSVPPQVGAVVIVSSRAMSDCRRNPGFYGYAKKPAGQLVPNRLIDGRRQPRTTLPALMHEVQTFSRRVVPPPAGVRTV